MTKTFNDKDIRDEIVNYVTHQFSHSYSQTKFMRALLKSQNLTIDEMIVPLSPEILNSSSQEEEPQTIGDIGAGLNKILSKHTKKINPIPNQKELTDYEWVFSHKHLLSPGYLKSFSKAYKSPDDNLIKELNGQPLKESRKRDLEAWKNQILRKLEEVE